MVEITGERRRRAVFVVLLGTAVLGAAVFMSSVMLDGTWRTALQVGGLGACAAASLAAVLSVRHWSVGDDFWWLDSGGDTDR